MSLLDPDLRLKRRREHYHKNLKKMRADARKYYRENRKHRIELMKKYRRAHVELFSVRNHYNIIFKRSNPKYRNYKGMPFYRFWNPKEGGSFKVAEKWILENIGPRPKGATLNIVDHLEGFVPGNLEWSHPRKQSRNQVCKIIAAQRNKIKKLEERIRKLERQQ